ncbi:MAG: heparinase II/III family protein [Candidatus Latescibacterota bacterium]
MRIAAALAVYFNCDGETILGDQGRYSYSESGRRSYFVSCLAHNTGFPSTRLDRGKIAAKRQLAASPAWQRHKGEYQVSARIAFPQNSMGRGISIPQGESGFTVSDTLRGIQPMVLLWNIGPDVKHITTREAAGDEGMRYEWVLYAQLNRQYLLSIVVHPRIIGGNHSVELLRGSSSPFLGWYAPRYLQCVPSTVIKLSVDCKDEDTVTMRIHRLD